MNVKELALHNAYGHLVDEIVNGNLDGLNVDALEAPELLAAVRKLKQQRDEAVKLLDDLWFDVCQGVTVSAEREQAIYDFLTSMGRLKPPPAPVDEMNFTL